MSLKLDKLEEQIARCCNQRGFLRRTIFAYPSEVLKCQVEVDRVRAKLSSGLYGQRTKEKIQQLVKLWDSSMLESLQLPPANLDMTGLVTWTLTSYGFTVEQLSEKYTATRNDRSLTLAIIPIKTVGTVFYLDRFEFKLTSEEFCNGYFRVPLRFYLACIHPAIYGSRPLLSLVDIPPEPLVEIAKFLDLETFPLLFATCSAVHTVCDSESVWSHVFDTIGQYTSSQSTVGDASSSVASKEKVQKIVDSHQRRRMMRFTQTVDVSDWATPFEFLSPTVGRRRHHDRLDDFII